MKIMKIYFMLIVFLGCQGSKYQWFDGTLEEAKTHAVEAIECHIEGLLKDKEPVPLPQLISVHKKNSDFSDGVWAFVEVEFSKVHL